MNKYIFSEAEKLVNNIMLEKVKKENIDKYNTEKIDIHKIMFSDYFKISNYLNDREVCIFINLGVPCGAIQLMDKKGNEISHEQEHSMANKELMEATNVYIPINSISELAKYEDSHFCSYTINPNFIEPKLMESFMYRFMLLTEPQTMFDEKEANEHQMELLKKVPINYKIVEEMKEKYITSEIKDSFLNKNPRLTETRYNELIDYNKNSEKNLLENELQDDELEI